MGLWGKTGDWKVNEAKTGKSSRSVFRQPRGDVGEIWVTSFCETHGFTDAKYIRAADQETSIFAGDCGCEIIHGGFCVTKDDGRLASVKIKITT